MNAPLCYGWKECFGVYKGCSAAARYDSAFLSMSMLKLYKQFSYLLMITFKYLFCIIDGMAITRRSFMELCFAAAFAAGIPELLHAEESFAIKRQLEPVGIETLIQIQSDDPVIAPVAGRAGIYVVDVADASDYAHAFGRLTGFKRQGVVPNDDIEQFEANARTMPASVVGSSTITEFYSTLADVQLFDEEREALDAYVDMGVVKFGETLEATNSLIVTRGLMPIWPVDPESLDYRGGSGIEVITKHALFEALQTTDEIKRCVQKWYSDSEDGYRHFVERTLSFLGSHENLPEGAARYAIADPALLISHENWRRWKHDGARNYSPVSADEGKLLYRQAAILKSALRGNAPDELVEHNMEKIPTKYRS
jgi:hypothetical protein